MAYVPNQDDLDEENKQQQQGQTTGNETVLAQPSAVVGSAGGAAGGGPRKTSTGWTNLQTYLTANDGNNAMHQTATAKIDSEANAVAGAGQTVKQAGQTAIDSGTVKEDTGLLNDVRSNAAAVTSDPNRVSAFKAQQTAEYKGPEALSDIGGYTDADAGYGTVRQRAAQTGDLGGRTALVGELFGGARTLGNGAQTNTYTNGMKRLDAALLGHGKAGEQFVEGVQGKYGTDSSPYYQDWAGVKSLLTNGITAGKDTTAKTRTDTQAALDTGITDADTTFKTLDSQAKTDAASAHQLLATNIGILTNSNADPTSKANVWNSYGIDPVVGSQLLNSGVPIDRILKEGTARNLGDLVTSQQRANYDALNQLAGKNAGTYDLKAAGGSATPWAVDQGVVKAGKQLGDMQSGITSKLAATQQQRADAYNGLVGRLSSKDRQTQIAAMRELGLTNTQMSAAFANGVSPTAFLKQGPSVNAGDVATDADRQEWANLMSYLGIKAPMDLQDSQNEGAGYQFDADGFTNAVGSYAGGFDGNMFGTNTAQMQADGRLPTQQAPAAIAVPQSNSAPSSNTTGSKPIFDLPATAKKLNPWRKK